MSTETQKVGVLAVMREMQKVVPRLLAFDPTVHVNPLFEKSNKAIHAVEDLIKAAKNIQSRVSEGVTPDPEEWDWLDIALARMEGDA